MAISTCYVYIYMCVCVIIYIYTHICIYIYYRDSKLALAWPGCVLFVFGRHGSLLKGYGSYSIADQRVHMREYGGIGSQIIEVFGPKYYTYNGIWGL